MRQPAVLADLRATIARIEGVCARHEVIPFGVESVEMGVGGSIPFVAAFADRFPDAAILITGVEDPDTRAHGSNESLHLGDWEKACVAEAILLARLGTLRR